jgi:hypothetical protein
MSSLFYMRPEAGLAPFLGERGIEFIARRNPRAVEIYNDRIYNDGERGTDWRVFSPDVLMVVNGWRSNA